MSPRFVALLGLLLVVPASFAADAKFGTCPAGYSCDETPSDDPFPPNAVTGHTVYASFVIEDQRNRTLGLPTDFAVVAGYFAQINEATIAVQRECVVWFNGYNLDQRPDPDNFGWGGANKFPSDEDQPAAPFPQDVAYQDYDFERDVEGCVPIFGGDGAIEYMDFVAAVEKGDCDPANGHDHRFRGHLDFVDPNHIYHEVQEYDYVCDVSGPRLAEELPAGLGAFLSPGPVVADIVKDMFPYTYTDEHNEDGCDTYETPIDNAAPLSGDPGFFDLGHKCNGSVQDLFTERMWLTVAHQVITDPTILQSYNFALQIDTCAGVNIYERNGKAAMGASNGYEGAADDPQAGPPTNGQFLDTYHEVAYHQYYSSGLDATLGGWPLFDVCTDGSSFSFDDTPRNRVVHSGPPAAPGDTEIMRGNSYDFNPASETFGTHRTNCRNMAIDWPYNTFPPGPPATGADCYPEDHKTAMIDLYVYDADPTGGLWILNSHGLTGMNAYVGPGMPTGPMWP